MIDADELPPEDRDRFLEGEGLIAEGMRCWSRRSDEAYATLCQFLARAKPPRQRNSRLSTAMPHWYAPTS